MTTAFDGGGNTVRRAPQQSTQPRDEACLSERAACSLGSPLVHRRSIRVARRAGRVGLRVCAHRTGQASPPASCCMSYSPRACAAHAAVVRHACAPVALAGPCAAVATPSCDACVVGCDESGASGFDDIRPVSETARSVHRGEMFPGMTPPMGLPMIVGFASSAAELLFADVHAEIDQSNTANVHGTAEGQGVRRKAFSLENLKLSLSPLVYHLIFVFVFFSAMFYANIHSFGTVEPPR